MLDINVLLEKLRDALLQYEDTSESVLYETSRPYYSPSPSLKIDPQNALSFLDIAIPMKKCLIDETTFYVLDLSTVKQTSYNTLVFQLFGSPLKTTETTTQVMERYFRLRKINYGSMKFFAKVVGITQKYPYVVGNESFAPDKGYSKNHVNWLAMHHVREAESIGNQSLLCIQRHHELILDLTINKIHTMATNIKLIRCSQQKMILDYLEHMNVRALTKKTPSIIDHMEVRLPKTIPNILSFHNQLIHRQAEEILSTLFKEGDPYREELKDISDRLNDNKM